MSSSSLASSPIFPPDSTLRTESTDAAQFSSFRPCLRLYPVFKFLFSFLIYFSAPRYLQLHVCCLFFMLLCVLLTLSLSVSVTYISKGWLALQSYSVCRLRLSKRLLVSRAGISKFFFFTSPSPPLFMRGAAAGWGSVRGFGRGTGRSWKDSVMTLSIWLSGCTPLRCFHTWGMLAHVLVGNHE